MHAIVAQLAFDMLDLDWLLAVLSYKVEHKCFHALLTVGTIVCHSCQWHDEDVPDFCN